MNFIRLYTFLILLVGILDTLQAGNRTSLPANNIAKCKQKNSSFLDSIKLPVDLQKIILGYIGVGWQVIETVNSRKEISDLYCYKDILLVTDTHNIWEPFFAHQNVDQTLLKNLSIQLKLYPVKTSDNNVEISSQNYRATAHNSCIFIEPTVAFTDDFVRKLTSFADNFAKKSKQIIVDGDMRVMSFARGDNLIIATNRQFVYLYRVADKWLNRYSIPIKATALAFSPDEKYICVGGESNSVFIINTCNGIDELHRLHDKNQPRNAIVQAVVFSSDGKRLYSGNAHGEVAIWEYQPDLNDLK